MSDLTTAMPHDSMEKWESVTILLLNNQPDTTTLLSDWFGALGVSVHHLRGLDLCHHVDESRQLLNTIRPDVILFDLSIPYEQNWLCFKYLSEIAFVRCDADDAHDDEPPRGGRDYRADRRVRAAWDAGRPVALAGARRVPREREASGVHVSSTLSPAGSPVRNDNSAVLSSRSRRWWRRIGPGRGRNSRTWTSRMCRSSITVPRLLVTCTGTFEEPQGTFALKFLRVWVRKDGKWRIVAGSVSK